LTNYTNDDITMTREFYEMPEKAQSYLVEFELFSVLEQLRGFAITTRQILEIMAGALFAHDLRQAHNFVDAMHLAIERFSTDNGKRAATTRHMWVGGYGINKIRQATAYSQAKVYATLVHWERDLENSRFGSPLVPFIMDMQFMDNLDRMLMHMNTFRDYNIRQDKVRNASIKANFKDTYKGGRTFGN